MRKIVLAGGSGFLGQRLEEYLGLRDWSIRVLTRNPTSGNHIKWDGRSAGEWYSALEGCDVVINLTGKSVDCRYTKANRKEILDSRVLSTRAIGIAVNALKVPPRIWLNMSSATIYRDEREMLMTESAGIIGNDFSMNVCKRWEAEYFGSDAPRGIRKAALRTSLVLDKEDGALHALLKVAHLGLGGHHGDGDQKVSWIHYSDFCRAVEFIIENKNIEGPVNLTAPNPTTDKVLMKLIRDRSGVRFGLNQPRWLLELGALFIRTETELILKSRNAYPEKLIASGFKFSYPTIEPAVSQ